MSMTLDPKWVPHLSLLLLVACSPAFHNNGAHEAAKLPLRGALAEFKLSSFDGEVFEGRLLLGASIDPLIIDARMMEYVYVEIWNVQSCDTKMPLEYYEMDAFYPPARSEQVITISPGSWYGTTVNFLLFGKTIKDQPKPDCFDAELRIRVKDGRLAATLPIHVIRTNKAPGSASSSVSPSVAPVP